MTATAIANDLKLQVRRTYNADPIAVFNAWTKPELIQQWFGSPITTIIGVTNDPRAGGSYRIDLESSQPQPKTPVAVYGTYTTFEPGRLLVFTWNAGWAPGEESRVTIALTPSGAGTELLLTHERFDSQFSRDGHNSGWVYALETMAKLFPSA